jgi:hypothetical protein
VLPLLATRCAHNFASVQGSSSCQRWLLLLLLLFAIQKGQLCCKATAVIATAAAAAVAARADKTSAHRRTQKTFQK